MKGTGGEREKRSLCGRAIEGIRSHMQPAVKVVALDLDAGMLCISVTVEESACFPCCSLSRREGAPALLVTRCLTSVSQSS